MAVHLVIVATLSLAAALCYGSSNVIEQRKASQAPAETSLRIALLWHLAAQPVWWLGIAVDIGGFAFQAWALALGPLVFVQPLLVTALPISLVIGHVAGSHRLRSRDVGWSIVFVGALAIFLVTGDPSGGEAIRPLGSWLVPLLVVACVVLGCVLRSHDERPARRSLLLGAAAGMTFGVSSTLIKSLSALVGHHGWSTSTHWEPYVLAGVVSLGFLITQSAFQAGDLRSALPAIELGEPVVAVLFGLVLFRERLGLANAFAGIIVVAAVAVMVIATVRLARSAATGDPSGDVASAPAC
ncbi:MAG: DMT family transporter [Actinobacteria bacterium]|nr:DMT family transporter [Actinomycetota bacterium]